MYIIFGEEIKILNNGDGEEYQVVGNFIHPCVARSFASNSTGGGPRLKVGIYTIQCTSHCFPIENAGYVSSTFNQ